MNVVSVLLAESHTFHSTLQQLYRKKPGLAVTCAKVPQNMDKNRYKDVLPCESKVQFLPNLLFKTSVLNLLIKDFII